MVVGLGEIRLQHQRLLAESGRLIKFALLSYSLRHGQELGDPNRRPDGRIGCHTRDSLVRQFTRHPSLFSVHSKEPNLSRPSNDRWTNGNDSSGTPKAAILALNNTSANMLLPYYNTFCQTAL